MSRRSAISDMISKQLAAANSQSSDPVQQAPQVRVGAGPVRTMGLTLERIQNEERALRDALATGASVLDLDPTLISPSFANDRFETEETDGGALRQSIADHGQETPILVRPHPDDAGRFQVAYGHRRLRACKVLGVKVRAVVRTMSDAELVIAQGSENAARVDLSFIEKATFAKALEERGFDRTVIMRALATDKTELSKLIATAKGIPNDLIQAIGPAPKAGRRRWMALAELLADEKARARATKAVASTQMAERDSDARFAAALTAASAKSSVQASGEARSWLDGAGRTIVRAERRKTGLVLSVDPSIEPGFDEFLLSRLDDLLADFRRR